MYDLFPTDSGNDTLYLTGDRRLGMHHYNVKGGGGGGGGSGSPKTGKNPAKPKFNKKESYIAKEEERKVFEVGKENLPPLLVVKK